MHWYERTTADGEELHSSLWDERLKHHSTASATAKYTPCLQKSCEQTPSD
jgi:hypothetical protein